MGRWSTGSVVKKGAVIMMKLKIFYPMLFCIMMTAWLVGMKKEDVNPSNLPAAESITPSRRLQPFQRLSVGGRGTPWPAETIEIPMYVVHLSGTLKHLVEDILAEEEMPLTGVMVEPEIIKKFFEYFIPLVQKTEEETKNLEVIENISQKIRALVYAAARHEIKNLEQPKTALELGSKEPSLEQIGLYAELADYLDMPLILTSLCQGFAEVINSPVLTRDERVVLAKQIMKYIKIAEIRDLVLGFLTGYIEDCCARLSLQKLREPFDFLNIGQEVRFYSVVFSPDSLMLASGSDDDIVRIWEVKTGKEIQQLKGPTAISLTHPPTTIRSVAFNPIESSMIAAGDDNVIRIWDVSTGDELKVLIGHTEVVSSVVFSPDGSMLASGSYDKIIRIWEVKTGKEIQQLTSPASIRSVTFSPDGLTLASGGDDNIIHIWSVKRGEEIQQLKGPAPSYVPMNVIASLAFSPDGLKIASGDYGGQVRIWNVNTGEKIQELNGGQRDSITSVVFSPDDLILIAGGLEGEVRAWNVNAGKEIRRLRRPYGSVLSVAFSPDGLKIAYGGKWGALGFWKLLTEESRGAIKHLTLLQAAIILSYLNARTNNQAFDWLDWNDPLNDLQELRDLPHELQNILEVKELLEQLPELIEKEEYYSGGEWEEEEERS